ncbi:MAG: SpoIIE family protein phosphatase [Candidatus Brocadiae bacterium]|nr:SpoIIE family protein phosphatase [Candidatus Brocadiia bacterium]
MPEYNIGDTVDSRYQLKKFLGGGRVGKVYLAKDLQGNQDIAIKILTDRPHSEREKSLFLREFAAIKNLNHPGVVKVYEQGSGYFTMEYIEGDPLIKKKESDVSQIFELGIDITRVLDYIHHQGVIHRDLKPENIKTTPQGHIKLLDFGFAIGYDVANLLSSGTCNIAGTINYMAPEVIKGFQVDPRTDLYSLGIILYELVTGSLPFKSADILTTILKQVEMNPIPPSELNAKITPGFEAIILKLIAKSPAKRFQSADELLSAMMRLAGRSEILRIKIDRGRKFLYSTKFIGREKELQQMESVFKKAMKGRGTFLLLQGEEGIGKSRLLNEFMGSQGILFLDVACESSMGSHFAAFTQIIYSLFKFLEKSNATFLPDLAEKWGPTLLPIVPVLTHKTYMFGITPKEEISHEIIQQTLCQFFIEISRHYALGIFIDNLEWMDSASAVFLMNLVEASQSHPIFISGAYQGFKSSESGFERILSRLKAKKFCEEIVLLPFSHGELEAMVCSMIGHEKLEKELLDKLYEISRGIPLLAEETIKNMADDALIFRKGGVWQIEIDDLRKIRRPNLLEDSLIKKYDELDNKSRQILQMAALLERRFSRYFLEELGDLKAEEWKNRLPHLVEQGFLSEITDNLDGDLIIGSLKLAELIQEKISVKTKQKLHEEIAHCLEKLPLYDGKIQELAHHYSAANQKRKALEYLISAGDICEKDYAYDAAIKFYEKALSFAEYKTWTDQIFTLLEKIGNIYLLSARYDLSMEYYSKGLSLSQKNNTKSDPFHKGLGLCCFHKGDFVQSKKHWEILLQSLESQNKNMAEELNLMASLYIATGEYTEAEKLLEKALDQAQDAKKQDLQAAINASFAEINFMRGYWSESMSYYTTALNILHRSRDQRLKAHISHGIAKIYIHQGRTKEAYRYLEEALYCCNLTGDRELKVMVELDIGLLFEYEGNLKRSREIYTESLEKTQDLGMKLGQGYAYLALGRVLSYYDNYMEALEYLHTSLEIFKQLQIKGPQAEFYIITAEIFLSQGEYDKASKNFTMADQILSSLHTKWKKIILYTGYSEVLRKTGKAEKANKILNKALNVAKRYEDDIMLGKIHTKYALFCADQDLNKEALEHFVSSLVYLERTNCRLELARAYYEYGRILLQFERKGDFGFIKVAIHQLEKAKEIYSYAGLQNMLNKTVLLIKECEREKSDAFYKRDLGLKLREFSKELSDMESETIKEWKDLKESFSKELEDDMDKTAVIAEIERRIAETEEKLNKKLEQLKVQNASLLAQVDNLKAERESLLTLQKISNTINTVLDSQKLLNLIMDMVVRELRAERGFLVIREGKENFNFKAARNIDREELSTEDFNLSRSIVKKVIKTGESVLTSDAQADARFQSESIMDLKLRSILCVPFKIKDQVIGVVYLDNRFVSGLFTERDLDFLSAFSNQAAIAIENAFLYEELKEKERIEQELSIAARIQAGLLPKALPQVPGLEVYGQMMPARQVGGDYYDFIVSPDNSIVTLVIGDVAGKGIPAGLVMVMARLILHHFLRDPNYTPRQTLLSANRMLKDNTEPFIFISLLLARWDAISHKFLYTGAGHENMVVIRSQTKEFEIIPAGGVVLGVKDDIESYLEEKELDLAAGDTVLFYTDGVTECLSASGEMLELDGFLEMARKHIGKSPKEMVTNLISDLKDYMNGREQNDDITLMAVRKL